MDNVPFPETLTPKRTPPKRICAERGTSARGPEHRMGSWHYDVAHLLFLPSWASLKRRVSAAMYAGKFSAVQPSSGSRLLMPNNLYGTD
ncbi:hypothetical protein SMMN14_08106 [Sphaerulina musiva]